MQSFASPGTGCLPLLIQLLHGATEKEASSPTEESAEEQRRVMRELRLRASQALHNVVHAHPDDKHSRREARVLRLLEQIRDFCDYLRDIEACIAESNQNGELEAISSTPVRCECCSAGCRMKLRAWVGVKTP